MAPSVLPAAPSTSGAPLAPVAPPTPATPAKKGAFSYLKAALTPAKKRTKAQKDAADSFATLYGKYQSDGTPLETKVAIGDQAAVEYWTPIILGDETLGPAVNTSGMSLEDMIRGSAIRLGIATSGRGVRKGKRESAHSNPSGHVKGKLLTKQGKKKAPKGPKALSRKSALESRAPTFGGGCFKPSLETIAEEPTRKRTGLTPPKRKLRSLQGSSSPTGRRTQGPVPSGRSEGAYGKSAYLDGTGRAALIKGIKAAGNDNKSIYL